MYFNDKKMSPLIEKEVRDMNRQSLKEEIQMIKNILKTPILLEIIEM